MSTEAPKDFTAVSSEIAAILEKGGEISEADQKILHDLREAHPEHFERTLKESLAYKPHGEAVTAAADAHAARVSAATPPAPTPAPTPAPAPATVAELSQSEKAVAEIKGLVTTGEHVDLSKIKSNYEQIVKILQHPDNAPHLKEIMKELEGMEGHGKLLVGLLEQDTRVIKLLKDAEGVIKGLEAIKKFTSVEEVAKDFKGFDEIVRGPNGPAVIAAYSKDEAGAEVLKALKAHGYDAAEVAAKAARELAAVEVLSKDIAAALKQKSPSAVRGAVQDVLQKPGALKNLHTLDSTTLEKLGEIKGLRVGGVPFAQALEESRHISSGIKAAHGMFTYSAEHGFTLPKEKVGDFKNLFRSSKGAEILEGLSPAQRAIAEASGVDKIIETFQAEIKQVRGLIGKSGKISDPAALEKLLKGENGAALFSELGEVERAGVVKQFPEMAKDLEAGAAAIAKRSTGEAAKGGELFKKATGFLRWSEEALAKEATKSGKTVAELAKEGKELGKFRGSRLAMLGGGVAAITAMFVAGSGNSGPGERAASIQQQGLGAAAGQGLA
jgi:hypothetical protein